MQKEEGENKMKTMKRKGILILGVLMVAIINIVGVNALGKDSKEFYPIPDKIVVYYENDVIEVEKSEEIFMKLFGLNKVPKDKNIMETSIEEDTITEIKEEMAVEYLYLKEQTIELVQGERKYTKILFAYSGWCEDSAIFYSDGNYQSGTISNDASEKEVRKIFKTAMQ